MTKHHIYAEYLTHEEALLLKAIPANDVSSEIYLNYILISRLLEIQRSAPIDMETRINILRTLQVLAEQLAKLTRVNNYQNDPLAELKTEIEQALMEVRRELGIENFPEGEKENS